MRDTKGRFPPGISGNKNGRPLKPRLQTVREKLNTAQLSVRCLPDGQEIKTKKPKKILFLEWIQLVFLEWSTVGRYYDIEGKVQTEIPKGLLNYFDGTMGESFAGGKFDVIIDKKYPQQINDQDTFIARAIKKLSMQLDALADIITAVELGGWQREAVNDNSNIVIMHGGRGAGRTVTALLRIVLLPLIYPNMAAVVVRKAREFNRNSTFAGFMSLIDSSKYLKPFIKNIQMGTMTVTYTNDSKLFFAGLKDDSQRNAFKGITVGGTDEDGEGASPGGAIDAILVEEGDAIEDQDVTLLLSSLRGKAAPFVQLMINTNPDAPTHHLYTQIIKGGINEGLEEPYTIGEHEYRACDNVYLMKTRPEYWTKTLAGLTGMLGRRYRDGEWVQPEGAVFVFDPARHVHAVPPNELDNAIAKYNVFMGIDTGSTDATCILWGYTVMVNRKDLLGANVKLPCLIVFREFHMWGVNLQGGLAEFIINQNNGKKVTLCVVGHDDPSTKNSLIKANINTRQNKEIQGYNRDVAIRIINNMFLDNRLIIVDNCKIPIGQIPNRLKMDPEKEQPKNKPKSVLDELSALVYNKNGKPTDGNDHGCNALENLAIAVDAYNNGYSNNSWIDAIGK